MNPKQDRQGVRTPADIERKYDLGQDYKEVIAIANNAQKSADRASTTANNAKDVAEEAKRDVDELAEIVENMGGLDPSILDGYVKKSGDTMTGNLTVKNDAAPYFRVSTSAQGNAQFSKNASTTADNGVQVIDYDASGNRAMIQVLAKRWNRPKDVALINVANADRSVTNMYEIVHSGNISMFVPSGTAKAMTVEHIRSICT